jgi:carboxylate-amine ligase
VGHEPPAITFRASPEPTVGIEVEMVLVDPESGALVSRANELLAAVGRGHPGGEHPRAKHELFQCTVEAITGVCRTVPEAGHDLRCTISELDDAAAPLGAELVCAATHPFSHWRDQSISPGERYTTFLDRLGWPVRRLAIQGMHVHVGVPSGEAAVAITHAVTEHLPVMLGLSASSPFWDGEDTAMASVRTKIFEALPTAGLPPELSDWAQFETFMQALLRAGAIHSIREVWWDVRPHPDFGTVELRMCDAMATLTETLAVAALAHCLVVDLQRRHAAGEPLGGPRDWVARENKWLAARHGLDTTLLVGDRGRRRPAIELTLELVERLSPLAHELGCADELAHVPRMIEAGTGEQRLRRVVRAGGTPRDVVAHLRREFTGSEGFR